MYIHFLYRIVRHIVIIQVFFYGTYIFLFDTVYLMTPIILIEIGGIFPVWDVISVGVFVSVREGSW